MRLQDTDCIMQPGSNGQWYCENCGTKYPEKGRRKCPSIIKVETTLGSPVLHKKPNRIMQFASEYAKWTYYGFPIRPAERRRQIHSICESCPANLYDKASDSCRACGCNMSETDTISKVRMATTNCPQGFWKQDV